MEINWDNFQEYLEDKAKEFEKDGDIANNSLYCLCNHLACICSRREMTSELQKVYNQYKNDRNIPLERYEYISRNHGCPGNPDFVFAVAVTADNRFRITAINCKSFDYLINDNGIIAFRALTGHIFS